MRFKTIHPDGDSYDGVVTQISRTFIALRESTDFELDGMIILPKKVIKGYRDSRFEECTNGIMRWNDSIRQISTPRWLDACDAIPDVLMAMKDRDIWPGVESLSDDAQDSWFLLGPIVSVSDSSFTVANYDAAGNWGDISELDYGEVLKLEFDDKYSNHFNEYMRIHNSGRIRASKP